MLLPMCARTHTHTQVAIVVMNIILFVRIWKGTDISTRTQEFQLLPSSPEALKEEEYHDDEGEAGDDEREAGDDEREAGDDEREAGDEQQQDIPPE